MLNQCHLCGHKAKIYKSETVTPTFRTLYMQCLNVDCMHRFVSNLTFSHTLARPDNVVDLVINSARNLSKEDQEQIQRALNFK